jgi:hypothetical protein
LGSCNQIVQAAIAPDWQRTAELPLRESDLVPQDFGTLVPNGTTNEISCGVTPGPNGFSVSASLAGDNVSPTAGPASGQTRLQIAEGFIGLDGNGTAQVTVYTALSGSVKSKAACWLKAQPDPQLTGQFAVQPGEARFMFVCDVAASNLDDFATCSTRGAVWLKDCTQ